MRSWHVQVRAFKTATSIDDGNCKTVFEYVWLISSLKHRLKLYDIGYCLLSRIYDVISYQCDLFLLPLAFMPNIIIVTDNWMIRPLGTFKLPMGRNGSVWCLVRKTHTSSFSMLTAIGESASFNDVLWNVNTVPAWSQNELQTTDALRQYITGFFEHIHLKVAVPEFRCTAGPYIERSAPSRGDQQSCWSVVDCSVQLSPSATRVM